MKQNPSNILYLGTLIPSLSPDQFDYLSTELTASESEPCQCCSCFIRKRKDRKKFTVRRMPGKIAHLVPMQRFDSIMMKRNVSVGKPSNTDFHLQSPTKLPPITTTSLLGHKNPPISGWPPPILPPFSSSHRPVHTSVSSNSLKPLHEQLTKVNNTDSDNTISQTNLRRVLSRFRQDTEMIPRRLDANIKRSSV